MPDRQRALKVLHEAREILAQRLTDLVVDQADEILADARGDSYMNEIDSLYEQVGMKLAHVGQMLSHLPSEPAGCTGATCLSNRTDHSRAADRGSAAGADRPPASGRAGVAAAGRSA
jgi:hypothetical protein